MNLTNLRNTEALGNCVHNWDTFYNTNYEWLYTTVLDIAKNTIVAREMTEKIMTHLVLAHPEIIAENNVEACQKFVAVLFPYLGITVDREKVLNAGRLLHLYYNPN